MNSAKTAMTAMTAAGEARESQVYVEIERLREAVRHLEELTMKLLPDRVQNVRFVRPVLQKPSDNKKEQEEIVQLAGEIKVQRNKIQEINDFLSTLISELEI